MGYLAPPRRRQARGGGSCLWCCSELPLCHGHCSTNALSKALSASVAVLTVIYWYTVRTAAGISQAGIWIRVLVVVPKSIHHVVTGCFHRGGLYGFCPHAILVIMVILLCASEIFQLRLIAPVDLRGSGWGIQFARSSAKVNHTTNGASHEVKIYTNLKMKVSCPMHMQTLPCPVYHGQALRLEGFVHLRGVPRSVFTGGLVSGHAVAKGRAEYI
jgi:hypothetical protein